MGAPDPQTCEAKIKGAWRLISLAKAKGVYAMAPKRCPACLGSVMINGGYSSNARRTTMIHRKAHTGCPLMPEHFTGMPSLHPQAMK